MIQKLFRIDFEELIQLNSNQEYFWRKDFEFPAMKLFEDWLVNFLIVRNVAVAMDMYDEHELLKLTNVHQVICEHWHLNLNQLEEKKIQKNKNEFILLN